MNKDKTDTSKDTEKDIDWHEFNRQVALRLTDHLEVEITKNQDITIVDASVQRSDSIEG